MDKRGHSDIQLNNFNDEMRQYAKMEEKRFRTMLDLLIKYRDFEDERLKIQLMQGSSNQNNDTLEERLNSLSIDNFVTHNVQQQVQNI